MKSIKPGRGPSAMGAVGSVFVAVFGMIWTGFAASMGAPIFFVLFGIVFVILAGVQGYYHYTNATGRNRMSEYDITEDYEEPDPLQEHFHGSDSPGTEESGHPGAKFCPYCGRGLSQDYRFCPECGKQIRG